MTPSPEGVRLEQRYRRLLIAYPSAYREERGEEMVVTLMSAAPQERRWPSAADALDLGVHGMRTRLRVSRRDLSTPRAADAAYRAALLILAVAAAAAVGMIVGVSLLGETVFHGGQNPNGSYPDPVRVAVGVLLSALPAALVAAWCGRDRLARCLAVAGGVSAVGAGAVLAVYALRNRNEHINGSNLFATLALLCLPGVLLSLGRREGERGSRGWTGRCLAGGVVLSLIYSLWIAMGAVLYRFVAVDDRTVFDSRDTMNLVDTGLNLLVTITLAAVGAWNFASGLRRSHDPRRLTIAWATSIPLLAAAVGTPVTPVVFRPEVVAISGRWVELSTNLFQATYSLAIFGALGVLARRSLSRVSQASTPLRFVGPPGRAVD